MKKLIIPIIGMIVLVGLVMCSDMSNAEDQNLGTLTASGSAGTDLEWEFYSESGTLIISGEGTTMDDLVSTGSMWSAYKSQIINLVFFAPNLENIGRYTFTGCANLVNTELPTNVVTIGDYAFGGSATRDATGLTHINLENVVTIGSYAFAYAPLEGELHLEKCNSIGTRAFRDTKITDVYLTDNLTTELTDNQFQKCTLNKLVIPKSCPKIGTFAYDGHINELTFYQSTSTNNTLIKCDKITIIGTETIGNMSGLPLNNNKSTPIYLDGVYHIKNGTFAGGTFTNVINLTTDNWGWYSDQTLTQSVNPFSGTSTTSPEAWLGAVQVAELDLNVQNDTLNLEDMSGTLIIADTEHTLVREFMVYPTDYETGADSGVPGMLLRLVPVFVLLAILGSVAYMFVNKRDL